MKVQYWILTPMLCCCGLLQAQEKKGPFAKKMITKPAKKAIADGLAYLAKHQNADGSWGTGRYKGDIAVTGLPGLAILSGGHKPGRGLNGKALSKALDYMLKRETINFRGKATPGFLANGARSHGPMYGHAFGTLFLAKVVGSIPDKKKRAKVNPGVA